MKNSFLDQFYTIDQKTGDYIIEIALKDYNDIFNSWDSSVYNIRDLDSSLKSFLEDCSYDIDSNKNIILRFNIHDQIKNIDMEKKIKKGIRNYFTYSLFITKKKFSTRRKRTFSFIGFSLVFTLLSVYFQSMETNKVIYELGLLGLTVGGWVFLWEAFSLLFIQSSDLWKKKKQYKRLVNSPVIFNYM